ncbi:metallophosphoesterase family protein [Sediminicoccus sp. KRV36]|uniref:metallophosphoesterase family protein n=1 Tax=Sediminicoccus sp. KRV36 TaxID=3133721 RepID=UPI00201025B3|nr:metallophosphoesterase family protein [Sediminicoccus rosea]UPY36193.1 metallophosphoesterase family protein [Sediminicoccus rosea]
MRIALLTDIHANLEALDACLAHAGAQGAERLVFLGDLVGYGADPEAVVARVRGLMEQGAIVLRGNHDEAALRGPVGFSGLASIAMRWTQARLDAATREFLANLPFTQEEEDRLYTHADASNPADWRYVTEAREARRSLDATSARLTFCGHTHLPALFGLTATDKMLHHTPLPDIMLPLLQPRRWLAVIGAVGQPRDGNPAACYGLLDTARAECGWMRVPYDIEAAARKIRAAELPEALAARLFEGA